MQQFYYSPAIELSTDLEDLAFIKLDEIPFKTWFYCFFTSLHYLKDKVRSLIERISPSNTGLIRARNKQNKKLIARTKKWPA